MVFSVYEVECDLLHKRETISLLFSILNLQIVPSIALSQYFQRSLAEVNNNKQTTRQPSDHIIPCLLPLSLS